MTQGHQITIRPEKRHVEVFLGGAKVADSRCPFKGQASYWSVEIGGELYDSVVWSYEEPIPQAEEVRGLMWFYNERVELTLDGESQPKADVNTAFS